MRGKEGRGRRKGDDREGREGGEGGRNLKEEGRGW